MKKIIISTICILIFILFIFIAFPTENAQEKNSIENHEKEYGLNIITYQNDVVKKEDLKFVKIDDKGHYIYKVKNKRAYYSVDIEDMSFEYSEY